ncbi:hypothetical protein PHLCEN_2v2722 [Hermanssonia centrifuga]|uniref:Uncharacterized protein n=1 Tax=Hermanssonia centrifuga TaxID=98765 RepID=A0A2R6RHS3_9APHY|nr:hypothetical protein PHLCEN_2v2722 [Hermanssonia centrifuga]
MQMGLICNSDTTVAGNAVPASVDVKTDSLKETKVEDFCEIVTGNDVVPVVRTLPDGVLDCEAEELEVSEDGADDGWDNTKVDDRYCVETIAPVVLCSEPVGRKVEPPLVVHHKF